MDCSACSCPASSSTAQILAGAAVTLWSLTAVHWLLYGRAGKHSSQDEQLTQWLCFLVREFIGTLCDGCILLHAEDSSMAGADDRAQELLGIEGKDREDIGLQLPLSGLCKLRLSNGAGRRYDMEACTMPFPLSLKVVNRMLGESIVPSSGESFYICTIRFAMAPVESITMASSATSPSHSGIVSHDRDSEDETISPATETDLKNDLQGIIGMPARQGTPANSALSVPTPSDVAGRQSRKPAPSLIGAAHAKTEPKVVTPVSGSLWQSMQVVGLGVGEYEKIRMVGSGGQGTVWQVKSADGTLFAQKEIRLKGQLWHRDFPKRLRDADREVRALKILGWASCVIVQVADCWINANFETASIVMEWMPWTLGQVLQERRVAGKEPPPVDLMQKWVAQLAVGVAAIHAAGFIHRDLKPSNIMLDESMQRCKITDLGVSRTLHQTGPAPGLGGGKTASAINADNDGASSMVSDNDNSVLAGNSVVSGLGSILSTYTVRPGTPDYTSPEALQSGKYGPPMDIFSLGAVLFEILTLEVPPMVPLGEVDSRLPIRATERLGSKETSVDADSVSPERKSRDELEDLCILMVSMFPENRPTAKDIAVRPGIWQHTIGLAAESEKIRSALGLPKQQAHTA